MRIPRLFIEAVVAVVIEETLRRLFAQWLPYGWLVIFVMVTWELLNTNAARRFAKSAYPHRRSAQVLSFVLVGVLGAAVLDLYWLGISRAFAASTAEKTPQNGALKLYADSQITVVPVARPSDGVLHVMQLQPNPQGNVIGQEFGTGSLAWTEFKRFGGPRIYTCKIINYGAETVINITVAIRVTFSKMIDEGGGRSRSGAVRFDADCPFMISKIDPGIGNAYTFYMGNFWNEFVTVRWPDTATASTIGDPTVKVVSFAHPLGQLFFPAFEDAAPKQSAPHK